MDDALFIRLTILHTVNIFSPKYSSLTLFNFYLPIKPQTTFIHIMGFWTAVKDILFVYTAIVLN